MTVQRNGTDVTLRPKQLVIATGMSGRPHVPQFPGMDVFKGDQHHSSQHPGPDGYESMNGFVAELVSQDVADKVGKVWGLGSDTAKDPGPWEGEQRNMWKPTQQEGTLNARRAIRKRAAG